MTSTYDSSSYEGGLKYSAHFRQLLATALVEKLGLGSVLELGCGPGHFLRHFKLQGVSCVGIDGCQLSPEELVIPEEDFRCLDLTVVDDIRSHLPENFEPDLMLSLEMLEHWPVEHDRRFFELLRQLDSEWVILSVARPGQAPMPGEAHPNCQEVDEVIRKMSLIGYKVDNQVSDLVRGLMLAPTSLLKDRPWADFYQRNTRAYRKIDRHGIRY